MDFTPDNPVTLVVKAPNQRIADQTIECMLGWTVKKLKQHLSSVYPSKPQETEQKLIYSGRLLQDHLTLKDVLRQYGEETQHTVHLVCSPANECSGGQTASPSTESMSGNRNPTMSQASHAQGEGLRHRRPEATPMTTQSAPQMMTSPQPQPVSWNQYMSQLGHQMPAQMDPSMMSHPAMNYMAYNHQQYMWMQHMYAQYMAQYMQYYQAAAETPPPATTAANTPPPPQNNVPNQPANQRNPQQPANQNIRMNAQGGPVDDDDDDELGQRDWLDWIYTLSRFGVLLSIVYFYSTMTRFTVVFLISVVVYLYEKGWFRVRRRGDEEGPVQAAEEPQAAPAPDPAQQEANPPPPDTSPGPDQTQDTEDDDRQQNESESHDASESSETREVNSPPPAEEAQPGALSVLWCFITTFFTSLVPQPPPAVNAN